MKPKLKILMIDDSQTVRNSYKIVLDHLKEYYELESDIIETPGKALSRVTDAEHDPYDIVCLDIAINPSHDKSIMLGEDLAVRIREMMPFIKIMIITHHDKKERLVPIYSKLQPEGLLLKHQEGFDSICRAIRKIREGETFYSKGLENIIDELKKRNK
ncbi:MULTISPECIES: response regulator transcription factor [unclassified Chryseobacterium]|uniref:response regulator transcription factor n=1 Tax=unclassified Chryseobacterium TaxID=2593645 RepID=UPI000D3BFC7C|nr:MULTISPECIES: response regulator transcription factor [unclassified Chryseobacterium]MCQ4142568.1 response regulator transcription factor [Chryseobacterium sp. EO14]PTT73128.1 hypothetical protein DBR25_13595 [Chryseobacterium sp. HMWF001]PVV50752.1 DNA-binding response regulator [Chryseobacterium sp. HMWF035]